MSDIDISEPLSDMLAPLNNEQKEFLMNNYTIQTYKKNETIYCEGETPSHLMCLISGKVKIFKDGVGGRSQIIRMIKPREYFAYRAYFAKQDFVTAAAAFEPSVVCLIPMNAILTLIAQNNDLAMFFIRQLSIDLGISDERTVNLTQKHIRGRLAESLIFLKESYGLEEDGSTLSIYLSREDKMHGGAEGGERRVQKGGGADPGGAEGDGYGGTGLVHGAVPAGVLPDPG